MTPDEIARGLSPAQEMEQRRFEWEVEKLREHQKKLRETELLWMERYGGIRESLKGTES